MLLLGGALAALSLGVLPLSLASRLALVVVVGLLQCGWARRKRWSLFQLLAWLLALLLLGGWGWLGRPQPSATDPVQRIPPHQQSLRIQLDARLLQDPRAIGAACQALAEVPLGRVRLRFRDCPELQQGWRVQLEGRLRRLRHGPHPLLPGAAERLPSKGVWSEIEVERWSLIARPPTPMADVRRHIAAELRLAGGEEPGGLLAALVLGQAMVPLPAALRDAFRAAGLSHALAASGFHLSVLLGAVLLLTRRAPALIRWPAAFGAMGLFGLLAGAQASVVRALLMGALAFVLKERGRRSRPLAVLLLCLLLMLLLRPSWLLDVGFQLSAAATGGLILSAGPLEARLQRWLPLWAAAAMAVPLAASLWTLPLQLLHFGVVPSYAVLSNVLAAPLLTPLTLGAMAMALTAVLMPPPCSVCWRRSWCRWPSSSWHWWRSWRACRWPSCQSGSWGCSWWCFCWRGCCPGCFRPAAAGGCWLCPCWPSRWGCAAGSRAGMHCYWCARLPASGWCSGTRAGLRW